MTPLHTTLTVTDCTVSFWVLEQAEEWRGRFSHYTEFVAKDGFRVLSIYAPQLCHGLVYLRGGLKGCDNDTTDIMLNTPTLATAYANRVRTALNEFCEHQGTTHVCDFTDNNTNTTMADIKNNTGSCNTGSRNTGSYNAGACNTGSSNAGSYNAGACNTGSYNAGACNTGSYNTGFYNAGSYNAGYFNTDEPPVRMFGKFTDMTESQFREKHGYANIFPLLTQWVAEASMTDAEKRANPNYSDAGGYLKKNNYKEAWNVAWHKASESNRDWFLKLPNFDANIFFEITGIDVRKSEPKPLSGKKVSFTLPNGETVTATID